MVEEEIDGMNLHFQRNESFNNNFKSFIKKSFTDYDIQIHRRPNEISRK